MATLERTPCQKALKPLDGVVRTKGSNKCHAECDAAWSAVNLEPGCHRNKPATKSQYDELIALWTPAQEADLEGRSAETPDTFK